MKVRELVMRCLKARVVSWLTNTQQAAVIPTTDGGGTIISCYSNGRYVEPQFVNIPDDVSSIWPQNNGEDGKQEGNGDAPS